MEPTLRYMNPMLTDRVNHLISITYAKMPEKPKVWKGMTHNQYRDTLENYESELMKANGFNFMVKNLPTQALRACDRKNIKVSYNAIRDTFNQFGNVKKLEIFKGTGYIGFKNSKQSKEVHETLNRMVIGENVLRTKAI